MSTAELHDLYNDLSWQQNLQKSTSETDKLDLQSTVVISKSMGLFEIFRDIRTPTSDLQN